MIFVVDHEPIFVFVGQEGSFTISWDVEVWIPRAFPPTTLDFAFLNDDDVFVRSLDI